MNRDKQQTLGEEISNAITHGTGALLSIAGIILLIIRWKENQKLSLTGVLLFGFSLFTLYLVSTLYHSLKNNKAKEVFKRLDHCAIYLLIAGSYSAITLTVLRNLSGYIIFTTVWILSIFGIVLKAIFSERWKLFSTITYVLLGWMIIFAIVPLIKAVNYESLILLILGGLAYTIGTIFFSLEKLKYSHAIWHMFVLTGSLFHFFSVFYLQ